MSLRVTKKKNKGGNAAKAQADDVTSLPVAPKRAKSAYLYFCDGARPGVKAKNADLGVTEIMKLVAAEWRGANDKARKKYVDMAKKDKERFAEEEKAFEEAFAGLSEADMAAVLEGGKKGKKKNAKKDKKRKRDPNMPKRPTTAFLYFTADKRAEVKEANPGIKVTDVSKKIGEMWRALDDAGKAPYAEKASTDRARWKEEMEAYEPPAPEPVAISAAVVEGGSTERKSKRAKKDPNAPKRPPSAYLLFSTGRRQSFVDANPGMKFTELSKVIGAAWRELSDADREEFESAAAAKKAAYVDALEQYNTSKAADE